MKTTEGLLQMKETGDIDGLLAHAVEGLKPRCAATTREEGDETMPRYSHCFELQFSGDVDALIDMLCSTSFAMESSDLPEAIRAAEAGFHGEWQREDAGKLVPNVHIIQRDVAPGGEWFLTYITCYGCNMFEILRLRDVYNVRWIADSNHTGGDSSAVESALDHGWKYVSTTECMGERRKRL